MTARKLITFLVLLWPILNSHSLEAQVKGASDNSAERALPKDILKDQKEIWTSPAHIHKRDLPILLPLGAATAALIVNDKRIERNLPDSPGVITGSQDFSTAGVAALGATAAGLYFWGRHTPDSHRREVGLLGAEAAADSVIVFEVLKYAARRTRPLVGDRDGEFWEGGDSFPSGHATLAWSLASVLAHEYPRPLIEGLAYGVATGVTATRVTGRRHFSSDVFIGSAIGWFIGYEVFHAHHNEDSDRRKFGRFVRGKTDSVR